MMLTPSQSVRWLKNVPDTQTDALRLTRHVELTHSYGQWRALVPFVLATHHAQNMRVANDKVEVHLRV